jgi:hypothetical protein
MFPFVKPCSEWTAAELQELQAQLYLHRTEDFDAIYQDASDNRKMHKTSLAEFQQHWEEINSHAAANPHLQEMHRDGHCHEAVMWLIHHVAAPEQQTVFARRPVPLLSTTSHSCNEDATEEQAALCRAHEYQNTCMDCHSDSGIPYQDPDLDGKIPEDPEHPGWNIQRRCDQNYDPPCGACDGVGGPYWGDAVSKFQPTNCEVIAEPDDVPEAERMAPQFAEQFTVHQLGSDRLSRVQNAGGMFTMYSQIRSTLWYDFPLGGESTGTAEDGMAKLRHDTFYDDMPYTLVDHGLVSEIHFQSREQREANVTGPMVSLLHGSLGWGEYLGGCTCVGDPVGVPVLGGIVDVHGGQHSAFMTDATYKGRIKIGVEYDGFQLGDKGNGDMTAKKDMIVDHYAKWFLHVFVDADPSSPTYGQPVRFYGPYSGFAVYVDTKLNEAPPSEVWDTACVENGWGTSELKFPWTKCTGKPLSDYKCMNVEKAEPEVCQPYENGASSARAGSMMKGAFGSVFVPDVIPEFV